MTEKQSVRNVNSDDLMEQLDPDTRITNVGVDPVAEEPLGAGDPALQPDMTADEQDNPVPPGRRRREQGLLGE